MTHPVRRPHRRLAAAMSGLLALSAGALAAADPARADGPDHLFFGAGVSGVLDDDQDAMFEAEFRPGFRLGDGLIAEDLGIAPMIGGFVTTAGAAYGYGGFGVEWVIDDSYVVMPFTGVGLYNRGDGPHLGSYVEFRSGLELGYRFDNEMQIGLTAAHLSNAGIGDSNPGLEVITLRFGLPLGGPGD